MMRCFVLAMWHSKKLLLVVACLACVGAGGGVIFAALPQGEAGVSPQETPEIRQVKPSQGAPGDELTLTIEGTHFALGAYVSFSTSAIRVVSAQRADATHLQTKISIDKNAHPGTVGLFVSNTASPVAETPFVIVGGATPAAPSPAPPLAPTAEIQPSQIDTPEVVSVEPPRATLGSRVNLKITGKNFGKDAKVSFSNPGIRVLEAAAAKPTELTARIEVAQDASPGKSSLFVVNPNDRETEFPFEVVAGTPTAPTSPSTSTSESGSSEPQHFEVINLGEGINILQNPNKPKGTLTVASGKIRYEEGGKEIFSASPAEVKEIDANVILGLNTGTFHIILNSGKTYNFVAASLRPADSQAIVDSLRRALH